MYLRHVPECLQFRGGTGIRAAEPDPCITYCWGMPRVFDQALIEVSALAGVCLREEVFPAEGKLLCLTLWPQPFPSLVLSFHRGKSLVNQGSVL